MTLRPKNCALEDKNCRVEDNEREQVDQLGPGEEKKGRRKMRTNAKKELKL